MNNNDYFTVAISVIISMTVFRLQMDNVYKAKFFNFNRTVVTGFTYVSIRITALIISDFIN